MTAAVAAFPLDYLDARARFRAAVRRLGLLVEAHPIDASGDAGLTLEVAVSPGVLDDRALVLSSGLHGIEGFLGSAIQLAVLDRWAEKGAPPVRCIFLHALNPSGYANLRRCDAGNIDLNRNFLLADELYRGSPPGYAELDRLLNPQTPPRRYEPFYMRALPLVARRGMPALKRMVAAGQYDFPDGLFYGGSEPTSIQRLLLAHLPRWLGTARDVVHLDIHTGLGAWATGKLLIDYPLNPDDRRRLCDWFGRAAYEEHGEAQVAYDARGSFGPWCVAGNTNRNYLFATAEFGTYGPLAVLSGLRAENRAHHWGDPASAGSLLAKRKLMELFCPMSPRWRRQVLALGMGLVRQAIEGLLSIQAPTPAAMPPESIRGR